jgi:serine/threonine protein kinase
VKIPFSSEEDLIHQERGMLSDITFFKHKHLVKLLATWTRDNKYHMLFKCAKWNLRGFWASVNPKPNFPTRIWAIEQMKGLASALKAIHIFDTTTLLKNANRTEGSQDDQQQTSIKWALLKVASAEARFGRHGDLKPENILLFDNPSSDNCFGVLQISDFGLSRFHRFESRSKVDPRTVSGSATYLPPELYLETPVSRAYDIWSLGCVYLEFVTWILEGPSGGKRFVDSRAETGLDPRVKDDQFYTELLVNGRKEAIIRQGVNSWIAHLRGSSMCSPMIRDLLDLMQEKMLLIAPQQRINASGLNEILGSILQSAQDTESNPQYCVVGSNSLSHTN